jgi:hypothetical protein
LQIGALKTLTARGGEVADFFSKKIRYFCRHNPLAWSCIALTEYWQALFNSLPLLD